MKRTLLLVFTVFSIMLFNNSSNAQNWVDQMQDPNANFYDVQNAFEQYWANKPMEKGKGWKQFKRWEHFMEPRVYPSGNRISPTKAWDEFQDYLASNPSRSISGNWVNMGPSTVPTNGGGAGRINCIRFLPGNTNIIFAGSASGGLWKSTDGGTTWTTNTDNLPVLGVTDIAIDPTNTNIMYLATGDGDAGDTYSIGVLKSTDGGTTWNTSGLNWTVNQTRRISKLLINPTNTAILIAATSSGIWRTTNSGSSWTQIMTGNFKDMEFKPGDPNTIYACGSTFWKSTNGGSSFTQITNGIPTGVNRLAIAVTPANSAYVYVLAGKSSDSGFQGMYRSTNSGTSFSTRATSPNLLGWSSTGNDTGGQSWYDLAIAASPTNAEVVVTGGVNIWRSTNGGSSWSINGHWTGSGAPYVHADHHDLVFLPGSGTTYFSGCDGGVFRTTNSGSGWSNISTGLEIAQMYRLSTSATNANLVLTGWQDNGTNRYSSGAWSRRIGGDGMECIIDHSNASIMYGELYYGNVRKSTDGGGSFSSIVSSGGTGVNENGDWVTPYVMSPTNASLLLIGKSQVWRSTNSGGTWSQVGTVSGGTGKMIALAIAPSNNNYIYAAKRNKFYACTNGSSFTDRTSGLPITSAYITYIAVNPTNPSHVWVTFSGYSSLNKVWVTTDAGVTWANYTNTGLPNLPVNCIVYQNSSPNGLYIGTDVGVYYRDSTLTSWQPFFTGLPNVIVNELEIQYSSATIRASTYGRGLWESDLYSSANAAPTTDFYANMTNGCPGSTIQFTDISTATPTSWSWSFTGGTPSTSTAQNPSIVYNTPGTYDVTLIATNINGSDTELKTGYITISSPLILPLTEGFQNTTFAPADWILDNPNMDAAFWERTTTAGGFGTSTASAMFDNYNPDVRGTKDNLLTPKYDFNGLTGASLTFDVAYARYSATYSDTLRVYVSTDCGATYTQVYSKGGTTLSTAPDNTSAFTPSSTQWRTETVSLNAYAGQSVVMVKFENTSGWGNFLYLDNVNITGTSGAAPVAAFSGSPTTVCAGSSVTFTDQSSNLPTGWSWTFNGGTPATSTAQNPTVVYNTAGTYDVTLTATNSNGSNTTTSTGYITVNPLPAVVATASPLTICLGDTTTLSASGAVNYSWSTGGSGSTISASPSSTTTYTATGTDGNGCSNTDSVTVTVNPLPAAPTITQTGTDLNSSASTGNQWYLNGVLIPGATAQTYTPVQSGNYTVTVTDANGCSSSSATYNFIITGDDAAFLNNSLTLFPNPNTGEFTLNFNVFDRDNFKIEVRNVLGQLIWQEDLTDFTGSYSGKIDLKNYGKGYYLLGISNSENRAVKTIVVY